MLLLCELFTPAVAAITAAPTVTTGPLLLLLLVVFVVLPPPPPLVLELFELPLLLPPKTRFDEGDVGRGRCRYRRLGLRDRRTVASGVVAGGVSDSITTRQV